MPTKVVTSILSVALLCGCASNAYRDYYHSDLGDKQVSDIPDLLPCDGPLQIFTVSPESADEAVHEMLRKGYVRIGWSSFRGGSKYISEADLISQAKEVRACAAVSASEYLSSNTTTIPLQLPQTTTSITNLNATVYGSGGSKSAYGTATTTTYGSQTTYVPITTQLYEGNAAYFVKRTFKFGAILHDADISESKKLGRNGIYRVGTIVRGTPAFVSDIIEGDFILDVDSKRFGSSAELYDYLRTRQGQEVGINLWRDGEVMTKKVTIAP